MKYYLCTIILLAVTGVAGATDRKPLNAFIKGADLREDAPPDDPPVDNPPTDDPPVDNPPPDDPPVDTPEDPPPDPIPDPQVPDMPVDTPVDMTPDPTDFPCDCIGGWDGGSSGGWDSGGDSGGGAPSPSMPLPPQVSNTALFTFSIKPGHEQNSRFNVKLSLPGGWSNTLLTPAIFQSSLRTFTLTIGSASFSGDIGAHGKISFSSGQSSFKGQINPGRNLALNATGLNLIELLSLDLSTPGAKTTVENISISATDLAGEVLTFYSATTVFNYSVTKQGAKGTASGS